MDGLPKFDVTFAGEDLDFIRASYTEPTSRGNRTSQMTFTRWLPFTDVEALATALQGFEDWVPGGGALVKGDVTHPHARMISASCQQSDMDPLYLIQTFTLAYGAPAS